MNRIPTAVAVALAALVAALPAFLPTTAAVPSASQSPRVLVNVDKDGLAIQGYDPVAYFTENKPVKGDPRHKARHQGATYLFASAQSKQTFEADPAKYAPQYGGYCGYAASIDKLSPISPEWFQVIDGRLILQHNKKAFDLWNRDVPGNVVKADGNWPGLVARQGMTQGDKTLVNVDKGGLAIGGYDPVAYFKDGRAVRGDASIEAVYGGGVYHFATVEHKEAFERDPSKYAPAYGGYCAYAASINKLSPVDPEIFQIEDGRLMLQHTRKAYDLFNKSTATSVKRADTNWPKLVARNGK